MSGSLIHEGKGAWFMSVIRRYRRRDGLRKGREQSTEAFQLNEWEGLADGEWLETQMHA